MVRADMENLFKITFCFNYRIGNKAIVFRVLWVLDRQSDFVRKYGLYVDVLVI